MVANKRSPVMPSHKEVIPTTSRLRLARTQVASEIGPISVLRRGTYTILWDDIDPLLFALRTAGFAAWLREYGELYDGSPIHIHAIAIGDAELSSAAQLQLTGEAGYFRGYSGLPSIEAELPRWIVMGVPFSVSG